MPTKEQVIEVAKQCYDPEIPVNIWDLGLIYDVEVNPANQDINVRMTLTTPHCPMAQQIPLSLKTKIVQELEVENVNIEVVFDPPWTPERISKDGKKRLGIT